MDLSQINYHIQLKKEKMCGLINGLLRDAMIFLWTTRKLNCLRWSHHGSVNVSDTNLFINYSVFLFCNGLFLSCFELISLLFSEKRNC